MKKKTTTINESARKVLGITRDDYALCDYVQFRQADRRGRAGWCNDPKAEIAEFIGITRPGIYKMLDRLSGKDLLYIDPATGNIQVTEHWIDTIAECKQSLQKRLGDGVNKVNEKCKQSLHGGVNKVTGNKEVKEDNKEEEGEAPAPLKTETPHLEDEGSPPPPSLRDFPKSQTPAALAEELRALYKAYPNEWEYITTSTPAKVFDTKKRTATVEAFCEWAIGEGWHRRDFGAINARLIKWFKAEPMMQPRAAAPHQAPAVGMRKSVPVYDANGLVTQ